MIRKNNVLSFLSVLLAFVICFATFSTSLEIFIFAVDEKLSQAEKPDFNYVAIGASNTNAYGMHGYNFEYVYEAPFEKENDNRYGYEMDTEGSYTTIIRDRLSENYNVNLYQIAMSSWRVEELHFLLDNSYMGDSYTDAWVYDNNGDGVSSNWYYGAALYEWNLLAQSGAEGYNHTPTPEELLATLRKATQDKVANADLITLDLGMNNFGTYMLNLLVSGMYSDKMQEIAPEFSKYYTSVKDYVIKAIKENVGDEVVPTDTLSQFADTLAYAIVGYAVNFDESVKEIYALNPDVDMVVVSIQNMMKGLEIVLPGSTVKIPFGDIFGVVVNLANLYSAVLSPYASKYNYANVSTNGRTEFFFDEISYYNGDSSSLSVNIKDCFNVYDGTLYLETRIQQMFAILMSNKGFVNLDPSQADSSDLDSLKAFHYGYHYGINDEYPVVTWNDGTPLKDFIKNGEAGKLQYEDKTAYEAYTKMLSVAYDVTAEIFREGTKPKIIDLTMLGMAAYLGVDTYAIVLNEVGSAIDKALQNPEYQFDITKEYPEGFYEALSLQTNIPIDVYKTAFSTALYIQFGGTVFAHPNENGYKEIANIIWQSYNNGISGTDVVDDQMSIEYKPTEESYFVAVGGDDNAYAGFVAEYLGLSKNQFGTTNFDNLDYSLIDKADLVSIGFDEGKTLDFMMNQLGGYLGNYFSVNVRATINNTISSMLDEIGKKNFFLQLAVGGLKPTFLEKSNSTIDELLVSYGLANKTMSELDWAKLLDDEQIVYVEQLKASIKDYLVESIGYETYVLEIDMLEWIVENGGSIAAGTPLESMLSNPGMIQGLLGDSAVLTIEVPIVDAIVFSIESYLYSFVEYTLQTSELISYINLNHPNTKIMLLSHFNPLRDVVLDMGSDKIDLGSVFEGLSMLSTARQFAQFITLENTGFVYLNDVETVYSASLNGEKKSIGLFDFLSMCSGDTDYFKISDEGHKQIAEFIMRYINIVCDHVYSDCDDIICNECGYVRNAVEHLYGEWFEIKAADYENEGEEGRICSVCGYKDTRPTPIKEKNDDGTTRDDGIVMRIDDPIYLCLIPVAFALIGIIVVIIRKKKNSK